MMISIKRTNSENADFQELIKELDRDLLGRYGEEQVFFDQFNKVATIKYVVLAYDEQQKPIACGAIKEYSENTMEVKRMYVSPAQRGKGVASMVLQELEQWAQELNYQKCILETGNKQLEAIRLYQKNNYVRIPNYGQYADVESSICFEKKL